MENNPSSPPSSSTSPQQAGGSVEPLSRATVARARSQTPEGPAGTRYELRDPFAEVTYRSDRFGEITSKADQLGSFRITSIAADGARSTLVKSGERWTHSLSPEHRAPAPHEPSSRDPSARVPIADKPIPTYVIDPREERLAFVARVEAALAERYVIKRAALSAGDLSLGHTEYRFKGDLSRIAFTETASRLATDTNSPSVARSMVDVAEARNWKAVRVSGAEDFRRMVWLDATSRGVKTVGYEPVPSDLALLKKATESRQANRIEPTQSDGPPASEPKSSGRGGGRKAVLVAIESILVAKGVSPARREAVMQAADEQLAARRRNGQAIAVKVYDASAATNRTPTRPATDPTRTLDRPGPTR